MIPKHGSSWFIPLGGFIGFVIGMILAAVFNVPSAWEQQNYPSITQSAGPAIKLIGFDYQSEVLFVKSKSQKIYQCRVTWPGMTTSTICMEAGFNVAAMSNSTTCRPIFPTLQPPGNVISALEASPCQDDAHLQIDYVILSDNSIWRLIQSSGGVGESLTCLVTLACAAAGTVLGLITGIILSRITRYRLKP